MEMTFKDIQDNKPLFEFCRNIWSYKMALESDMRYLFLCSLISADSLVDAKSCEISIDKMNFMLKNIELFDFDDERKKEIVKFLKDGLKIAKRDLKDFKMMNKS